MLKTVFVITQYLVLAEDLRYLPKKAVILAVAFPFSILEQENLELSEDSQSRRKHRV